MSNFWEARRSDIEVMKDTVGMGRASEAAVEGKAAAIGDVEGERLAQKMSQAEALARLRAVTERRQLEEMSFAALVRKMRRAQAVFFASRSHVDLIEARRLEKLVDAALLKMD